MSAWWLLPVALAVWAWLAWRNAPEDPFDLEYPDSAPAPESDFGCPDTEPTSPGALDSDLSRLQ